MRRMTAATMKDSEILKSSYHFLESLLSKNQVSYLILYVTNRCNFRCDFCFYYSEVARGRKTDELTLQEIRQISSKLGPLIQLSLTGGEPFLRDDLAQITSTFIENNFVKYITIPTNASLTQRMVNYLEYLLPLYPSTYFRVPFSIDGIGEAHDAIRSSPGSYKKIQKSYKALSRIRNKYPNLVLDANSVFTANNQNSLLETLQHIHHEFDFDNISVTYARGDIKDLKLKKSDFKKYLAINDYLENLTRNKEDRTFYPVWRAVRDVSREYLIRTVMDDEFISPCTAGRKLLIIQETGEVYPCEILKESMGNLRDYDFDMKQLLSTPANQELLEKIERSKCRCTFECALAANVIWGKSAYLKLLRSTIKNIGRKNNKKA
jgi:radical SAM protein with 4Fe4S-binding SPASM domain